MDGTPRAITWEAPEHHHVEKGNDWFFALAVIIVSAVIVALLFGDVLFALLIGFAGGALAVAAVRGPRIVPYAISVRGVRVNDRLYPYSTLVSYHIDEEDPSGPQLLIKSERRLMPLIVMPIPSEYVDDVETILKEKLEEEELFEPLLVKLFEMVGL
jgi:hypothetical protein